MSLRKLVPLPINQEKMPKISKPRKKTTTTVKKTIPQKKEASVEYIVTVFFKFDQRLKKQFSVISLATVKLFTSLSYEISVDVQKGKNSIDIRLLGLNTRQSYYVSPNPASTELLFENLFGKFNINIIKQDGSINCALFDFNIYKKEIKLIEISLPKKKNNRMFVRFEVPTEFFSFK
ncbi:MAG: hypothetical protein GW805_10745 [Ignavibacteria bacterium]|nr:hypothetical protein [Ignavibacteria bacterium]OIO14011.1 MAG: hypothetical protein AUJ54_15130 [Ignavibacteria bacterium CG1_02_37_35]PIS44045.1 MAG: hypothetical protein COT22_12635 [Ignavibacteria bacterium CG08_land_8_20_14_0_20_37_9]PIX94668.1 MAG: hypothetical protein COZ25_04420 [Ignavibacteria bacterium CG_4_10_14_3_um_filter_37_18]PJC59363.1 MAG: hypothetical protein CO025_06410 [Ignavibacteria bacterium CG_4_9_14_0_2_um_filter_37_13]